MALSISDIETGRIFFLGAGFSAAAGLPLTNSLLPQAAALFRAESPGLFERISWWAESVDIDLNGSPDAVDFAKFCTFLDFMELRELAGGERWSDEGSRERVALKFYLAKAIALATPEPQTLPAYFLEFAKDLNPGDVVVTFNWDTLLESVLNHVGTQYSYAWDINKVQILKLHGSINWIEKPNPLRPWPPRLDFEPLGYEDNSTRKEVYSSVRLHESAVWRPLRAMVDGVWPLLVLPGYGKAVDARLLSSLWYRPEMLNIRGGGVSVIGLSVADDDYIMDGLFRYLFRATFGPEREVTVINPDASVGRKFKVLTGDKIKLRFLCARFDQDTLGPALQRV